MKILDEQEQLREERASVPADSPDISVFLPVFNEEPNLLPLHAKLDEALKSLGRSAEIVYVDDDNLLAPDYLAEVVRIAREWPELGAWGGHIEAEFEPTARRTFCISRGLSTTVTAQNMTP